jgi:hypothetical protein
MSHLLPFSAGGRILSSGCSVFLASPKQDKVSVGVGSRALLVCWHAAAACGSCQQLLDRPVQRRCAPKQLIVLQPSKKHTNHGASHHFLLILLHVMQVTT